ncbi:uncharacterized protein LOC112556715 isoform X2 [Pomacea canaliculata]|uniref:uncharacterized protein LOC112556715 isoform X2 n=1 Tax=Pomacea canaliculata TaxID=400727 RepID=UPI000D72D36F|nr:uncharacterized protein LOC112556715 isoform X2 [Pomacea canaliculata]
MVGIVEQLTSHSLKNTFSVKLGQVTHHSYCSRVQSLNKIVCYRQELDEEERTRACSRNVEIDGLAVDMDAAFTVSPSKCFSMQDFIKADSTNGLLHCYFCQDTFEKVYDPYTDCQTNVSNVPVDTCLDTNKFCMTQRTTVKGITVSISRSCTDECYYGCMFYDFGVTQFICTSCCNYSLCNTDAGTRGSHHIISPPILVVTVAVGLWTSCIILKEEYLWRLLL